MTYNEFIQNIIDTRGQWSEEVFTSDRGCEMHHIVPACSGGEGDYIGKDDRSHFKRYSHHSNCIYLYPAEHFKAHYYLAKDNPLDNNLCLALNSMLTRQGSKMKVDLNENLDISANEYEEARILARDANSRSHAGIKQTKERIENRVNKNRGQKRSEEQRQHLREGQQRYLENETEEHKQWRSEIISEATKKAMWSPDIRENYLEGYYAPEARQKQKEGIHKYWESEEAHKKASEAALHRDNSWQQERREAYKIYKTNGGELMWNEYNSKCKELGANNINEII